MLDLFNHIEHPAFNIRVAEPNNCISIHRQMFRPCIIVFELVIMHSTVDLDSEFRVSTVEIQNELTNGMLPSKSQTVEPSFPQLFPKSRFRRSHFHAKVIGSLHDSPRCPTHQRRPFWRSLTHYRPWSLRLPPQ